MKKTLTLTATLGVGLLALSNVAMAATTVVTGSLDASDPTWDGCGSSLATACNYDAVQFTVDTDGDYTFDAFYDGDTTTLPNPEHLDGILEIYEGAFDPLSPGAGAIAFDDDGPGGSNTSQIELLGLTAGTTYFFVVSSFTNAPGSFGQPNGAWEVTIDGPGTAAVVPVPAALWLLGSALIGLGAARRKIA